MNRFLLSQTIIGHFKLKLAHEVSIGQNHIKSPKHISTTDVRSLIEIMHALGAESLN